MTTVDLVGGLGPESTVDYSRDGTRQELVSLVGRLRVEHGTDGVILGGTELPLPLPTPIIAGLPALDTTALHVAAIVERLPP